MASKKGFEPINPKEWKSIDKGTSFVNNATGEKISRRQFYNRKRGKSLEAAAKERKETGTAKPRAARGSKTPDKVKEYAEQRGATAAGAKNGFKEVSHLSPTDKQTAHAHNKLVNKQRRDAISFKFKQGVISEGERNRLMAIYEQEKMFRERMLKIEDQLRSNKTSGGKELSKAQRIKLNEEYRRTLNKYETAHKKLEKANILPDEGSDLYHGYYH